MKTSSTATRSGSNVSGVVWLPKGTTLKGIMLICSFLSLSKGATARGGPRPSSRVSSILPGLGRLFSNFYTLPLLHLPPLHLPNAAWVSLWGAFLLARWGGLFWINHRRRGIWHVLPISVYSACRISQCHSHWFVVQLLIKNFIAPVSLLFRHTL